MPWVLLYSPGSLERSDQDADVRLAFHLWSLGSTSPLTKAGPWGCRSVFEALVGSSFTFSTLPASKMPFPWCCVMASLKQPSFYF